MHSEEQVRHTDPAGSASGGNAAYWEKLIADSRDCIIFYNIRNRRCKSIRIDRDPEAVSAFLRERNCSALDFCGSLFALYLARIHQCPASLLKMVLPGNREGQAPRQTLLRAEIQPGSSFVEVISAFQAACREAEAHTDTDVGQYIREWVTGFSILDLSRCPDGIPGDLAEGDVLSFRVDDEGWKLLYHPDFFTDGCMSRMARNISCLADAVLSAPERPLDELEFLSSEEADLLVSFSKGKTLPVDEDRLLSHAFREHAAASPERVAVDDGVHQISYGELERTSNAAAADLYQRYGIRPSDRVAVMLPRDYHFPEMILALNKIGAAYVPVDPRFPANRIEHMLRIARAERMITVKPYAEKLSISTKIICLEELDRTSDSHVPIGCGKDDLLAVIFTSGTTGIPKGVGIYNRKTPWACNAYADVLHLSPGETMGSLLSFSFVASFLVPAALYLGCTLRLFNEEEQKNSLLLLRALKENHIHSLMLPPGLAIPVYEKEELNLDYLIVGGAKMKGFSGKGGHTRVANLYGATEVIYASIKIFDRTEVQEDEISSGRPVPNTWIYILDRENHRMPVGTAGEICVAGAICATQYCEDPELSSACFVENPFADCDLNRIMYRTGDIGYFNEEGEIVYVGRKDDQLCVRGFRIESGEILSIMKGFPEITDIYLDVDRDVLTAYYEASADLDPERIRKALEKELPYYMIPSLFVRLDRIPLNLNGKIDRTRIKTESAGAEQEITDETIRRVTEAFRAVLELDQVLPDDGFLALGGDSLSAMKLQMALNEAFGVNLSPTELVSLSTPEKIAAYIQSGASGPSPEELDRYSFDQPCPLSESQLNVYLDENVRPMGTAYNTPFRIRFPKAEYGRDRIRDALRKLLEVYPVLRARVVSRNGVPSMIFDGKPEIAEGSGEDAEAFVRPFETDRSLCRFLIAEDGDSVMLCADFHHLIFDGTSLSVWVRALFAVLRGEPEDQVDRGALRAVVLEEIRARENRDEALAFFDRMLADREEAHGLIPSVNSEEGAFRYTRSFDMDMGRLRAFLRSHSLTPNQFFTSAFAYTLSRFTGSEKVLFNLIGDGRGHLDLSRSVGMFVKTLPVLADCRNQETGAFLSGTSDVIASVLRYDMIPYRELAGKYDLHNGVLFQYSHSLFADALKAADPACEIQEFRHDLDADLSFNVFNNGETSLSVSVLYSSLYAGDFIARLADAYMSVVREMMRADTLAEIRYISDEDTALLDRYNQTDAPLAYEDVLDAFNDHLAGDPGRVLVEYEGRSWTYAEGASIACRIGQKLSGLGLKPQDAIGFLVPRSELYLFCVLGIVSLGCAYVPLDETLPDERIAFMIRDSGSKALIVSDDTLRRAEALGKENLILLNVSDILKEIAEPLLHLPVLYGDPVSILYTSGSTGAPKGVRITRQSVLNFSALYAGMMDLRPGDVNGLYASIGFDVSMGAIFSTLYSGTALNVIPDRVKLDVRALNRHLIAHQVSHSHITTQIARLFISQIRETSLRVLVTGGEKLGQVREERPYRIVDTYGPTEACVYVTQIDLKDKLDSCSVGFVVQNTKAYVLDSELRRVPIGAAGNLYLSGMPLAAGYLNRDRETAEAFLANPFEKDEKYGRMYFTGDVARMLPDGTCDILGRRDGQVKIRGNRVELAEIEAIIGEMEAVRDVTTKVTRTGGESVLSAYIVSDLEEETLKNQVTAYLSGRVPPYMIPAFIIRMDRIPLNANGKVDRRRLPEAALDTLQAAYTAPRTEMEARLIDGFEQVFQREGIGIHDDFIRLGGDSLTAVKLVSILGACGSTAADILNDRTPAAIAAAAAGGKEDDFPRDLYSLETGCPLNNSQLYIYQDVVRNHKSDSYLIPSLVPVPKQYGKEQIMNALDRVFAAYPVLSMRVEIREDKPCLVMGHKPAVAKSSLNLLSVFGFLASDFDIADSLSRHMIVSLPGRKYLVSVFHHLIFDLISSNVFARAFRRALDGDPLDYVDDAFLQVPAFQEQMRSSPAYEETDRYVRASLGKVQDVGFFLHSGEKGKSGFLTRKLEVDQAELKAALARYGISRNILFTAAMAYTLSALSGREDVAFGVLENGRDRFNAFDAVGLYINGMPVLAHVDEDVEASLEGLSDMYYRMLRHNYYPFAPMTQEFDLGPVLLFQFIPDWIAGEGNYDQLPVGESLINKIIAGMGDFEVEALTELLEKDGSYTLRVVHSGYYSRKDMNRLTETYQHTLSRLIRLP